MILFINVLVYKYFCDIIKEKKNAFLSCLNFSHNLSNSKERGKMKEHVNFSSHCLIGARIKTYKLARNYDVHIKDIISLDFTYEYIDIEFHDNLNEYRHVQSFSDGATVTLKNGTTIEYKAET